MLIHTAWHRTYARAYHAQQAGHHLRARLWAATTRALAAIR